MANSSGTRAAVTPSKQVAAFIAKFDPRVASVIRSCRLELRRRFPTATEMVYDNYNFFVIGYSSTSRVSDCVVKFPMPSSGRIRTIVKSISAKQRPRRASPGA